MWRPKADNYLAAISLSKLLDGYQLALFVSILICYIMRYNIQRKLGAINDQSGCASPRPLSLIEYVYEALKLFAYFHLTHIFDLSIVNFVRVS